MIPLMRFILMAAAYNCLLVAPPLSVGSNQSHMTTLYRVSDKSWPMGLRDLPHYNVS